MHDAALSGFREAAAKLAKREKIDVWTRLKDGRILTGLYDPMFRTITLEGVTFPYSECNLWVRLFYGCEIAAIKKGDTRGNRNSTEKVR